MRILYIYRFLTHGGVEAVLKTRIKALKKLDKNLHIGVLFLYKLVETSVKFGDDTYITNDYNEIKSIIGKYDIISVIDAPEVFELLEASQKPLILEVHTTYMENRMYLQKKLPSNIKKILTPSKAFKKVVEKELKDKGAFEIDYVYNPLDYDFYEFKKNEALLRLNLQKFRPVLWVGRLDYLKNWERALEIFSRLIKKTKAENFELFFVGKSENLPQTLNTFKKYNLFSYIRYLPFVDFDLMPYLYKKVLLNGGIYLSTSKGESFGMTVAEAMAVGVPCVLNRLEVFEEITDNKALFFKTDEEAVEAILKLLENKELYEKKSEELKEVSYRYHPDNVAKELYEKYFQVL